ncbi:glucose-1-phosphate adenylyltransferase subunit GlgD [Paenibacillus larvae]
MKQLMGVINLVHEPDDLEELTIYRNTACVPFGGRYRLIDFMLSNMVNSGIGNVAVFTHHKYRSLMDHLGSGKEWDLDRKRGGLFLLPSLGDGSNGTARGDLFQLYTNRDFFYRGKEQLVLLARSHVVCNIQFDEAVRFHEEKKADITIIYKEMEPDPSAKFHRLAVRGDDRITVMEDQSGRLRTDNISLEMYIMNKELFLDMVESTLARGYDYIIRDGILKNTDKLGVYGYRFDGHAGIVTSINSYYRYSMELLCPNNLRDLFFQNKPIYTKIKDEPPAKHINGCTVKNSLVANGCVIKGTVKNSILFRGVRVEKGAVIKNSIIMQNCVIRQNAKIENSILDKDVLISPDRSLCGDQRAPFVAAKTKVI